jgi:hypothetical protein
MRKRTILAVISLVIISGICAGCSPQPTGMSLSPVTELPRVIINSQTTPTPQDTLPARPFSLDQAKPYRVVEKGNLANDDAIRTAGLWYITSPEAESFGEYAQTAVQAVLDLYRLYKNNFTAVDLIPWSNVKANYAEVSYSADGKGAQGMTGSARAVPMYWKVRAMDDLQYDEKELAIIELWQQKMSDFPNPDLLSSMSYDEKALKQYISDTLHIPYAETQVRSLNMLEYPLDESIRPWLAGPEIYPNTPQSEAVLQTLSEPSDFTAAEMLKIIDISSKLPSEVKPQFDSLYEVAEKVSHDSRWMFSSAWRPYVQSTEYQLLLQFCQEKGQAVWPLLFQRMNTESRSFAGGLIMDLTLPEYVYFLERSVENNYSEYMMKYVQALLALL